MISLNNSNIRSIDGLGRIVIPKNIRNKLHINSNEELEIYIENEKIIISKYSSIKEFIEYIKFLEDNFSRITGKSYIFTENDIIIASTDKTLIGKKIEEYEKLYEQNLINYYYNGIIKGYISTEIIIIDGHKKGLIIEYSNEKILDNKYLKLLKAIIEKAGNTY